MLKAYKKKSLLGRFFLFGIVTSARPFPLGLHDIQPFGVGSLRTYVRIFVRTTIFLAKKSRLSELRLHFFAKNLAYSKFL
jgi:hypothetical protein